MSAREGSVQRVGLSEACSRLADGAMWMFWMCDVVFFCSDAMESRHETLF